MVDFNIITETFTPGRALQNGSALNNIVNRINRAFGVSAGSNTYLGPATTPTWPIATTADGLTATVSGTQTTSLLLTAQINRISTVASGADGVRLLPANPGVTQILINDAASNAMQVFGSGTDTINDVATATGVSQAAGKTALYTCSVAGKWYRLLSA